TIAPVRLNPIASSFIPIRQYGQQLSPEDLNIWFASPQRGFGLPLLRRRHWLGSFILCKPPLGQDRKTAKMSNGSKRLA
ncbi:MAG: hypothetical protein M3N06_06930, partial [Pseudomonadota bacterium]|nr:hypothetical protein [Pseudomonadota bacterium]